MSWRDKFDEFADRATELADKATDRARGLAAEHNDTIDAKLDRAAGYLDEKTGGKYAEKIGTGVDRAKDGLDRFAEQPSNADEAGTATTGDQPTGDQATGERATGEQGRPADRG